MARQTKPNEKAARSRAREIALALANGRSGVLELTNTDRESYLHAKALLAPFAIPLHSAIEEWSAARKVLGDLSLPVTDAHNAADSCAQNKTQHNPRKFLFVCQLARGDPLQRAKCLAVPSE